MVNSFKRYRASRYQRIVKKGLLEIDENDNQAFQRWLATSRLSAKSQQVDLPSSQIPPVESIIMSNKPQLLVMIDTCSIVHHRTQFISHVTDLKNQFLANTCPIRFMISLTVLEELDKFNRPKKRKRKSDQDDICSGTDGAVKQEQNTSVTNSNLNSDTQPQSQVQEPPRSFMRFLEEELRTREILMGELDSLKKIKLNGEFEIVRPDDRILDSLLRSNQLLKETPHNEDTNIILLTEDNILKSKASNLGIISYRWLEYRAKYRNFLQKHYTSTPQVLRPTTSWEGRRKIEDEIRRGENESGSSSSSSGGGGGGGGTLGRGVEFYASSTEEQSGFCRNVEANFLSTGEVARAAVGKEKVSLFESAAVGATNRLQLEQQLPEANNKLSEHAAMAVRRLRAALELDKKSDVAKRGTTTTTTSNATTEGDVCILKEIIKLD